MSSTWSIYKPLDMVLQLQAISTTTI